MVITEHAKDVGVHVHACMFVWTVAANTVSHNSHEE